MKHTANLSRQGGFGAVMAIIVLVILATLAAAMTRFGSIQHMTSAQDVLSVRALAAARSGLEEGLYRALRNNECAATATWHRDLNTDTGFVVSIRCEPSSAAPRSSEFHEGESTPGVPRKLTVYNITATACNIPTGGACPNADAVTSAGYVERVLQTVATSIAPE
jgi:MSHA biogenesis protein MshP